MKIKVGTQVERETYQNLKIAAARERRAISEIIQEAIEDYLQQHSEGEKRAPGLARLLEPDPLRLTSKQIRESLTADFFDQ
jgi:hypothetical protein